MIATVSEIKTLLQLTDSTYDTYISAIIPSIEEKIFNYTRNHFVNDTFDYICSSGFVFAASDNSISLTGIGTNYDLAIGDSIRIYKSLRNNKVFTIESMTTDKIILDDIVPIKDESSTATVYLTALDFPLDLKMTVASMVQYKINMQNKVGMASEKIDDYQVNFSGSQEYPMSILASLNDHRHPYTYDMFEIAEILGYSEVIENYDY